MRTWDDWSDFEVNKAVAEALGLITNDDGGDLSCAEVRYAADSCAWNLVDYCNKPADMWPIILDNDIEISPLYSGKWCASPIDKYTLFEQDPIYNLQSVHKNPLRAAATVFLMMNGVKPD